MDREEREDRLGGKRKYVASKMRNRDSTDEIAILEAELRRAYWKKELAVQLSAKETEKSSKLAMDHLETEKNRLLALIELEEEDQTRVRKRDEARKEAVREIAERMARKAEERARRTEEGLREREYLEELERRLEEQENSRTLEKKLELARGRVEDRRILSELMEIRLALQEAEEEKLERDRKIYSQEIKRRADEERSRRTELKERRERVLTSLLTTIIQETNEREKKRLLEELVFEELELERTINEWKERNVKSRMAKALHGSLKEQISLTELCKASFLRRDQEFAEEASRRLAEDEKIVRLTADARKRALLRYHQDLERMIVERRRIRDEQICRIEEEIERERILEASRAESIKRERESLLLEHASNVGDFLNKNLLTKEERNIFNDFSLSSKNQIKILEDDSSKIRETFDSQEKDCVTVIIEDLNILHLPK